MMKPVDGQPGVFTTEAPKFKIGDRVRVNLKAARAVGYTGPEVGVIDNIDNHDCSARIVKGGSGPFVLICDIELEFIVGDRVQTPDGNVGLIQKIAGRTAFINYVSPSDAPGSWWRFGMLTPAHVSTVVRYKGRVEPSGALAEPPRDPAKVLTYYGDGGETPPPCTTDAGIVKCLRCGGPAGYLGLRCERVGGCRTAAERVGEPPPGTIQKGRWRYTDEPSWSWDGAGARAWATEALAIAAWKAVRLSELESIERGLR